MKETAPGKGSGYNRCDVRQKVLGMECVEGEDLGTKKSSPKEIRKRRVPVGQSDRSGDDSGAQGGPSSLYGCDIGRIEGRK